MALKATIFKASLEVTDMDRNYCDHMLTLALHPSEPDHRMMVRLLAFALHANDRLQFTKGLSSDDEPDLWQKNLSDEIELWIDLGLPDEKRVQKACARAQQVAIYSYQQRSCAIWWQQQQPQLARFDHLMVVALDDSILTPLAALVERTMALHCTIQDGIVWLGNSTTVVEIRPNILKPRL